MAGTRKTARSDNGTTGGIRKKSRFRRSRTLSTRAGVGQRAVNLQWGKAEVGPFAQYMKARLIYVDWFYMTQVSPPSTIPVFWSYRINSIFDPDYSATGHQPMYHDQYAQLYTQYRVDKVKIICEAALSNYTGYTSVLSLQTNPFPVNHLALFQNGMERSLAKNAQLVTHAQVARFVRTLNIYDALGVQKKVYESDAQYWTDFGSNPSSIAFASIVGSTCDPSLFAASYQGQMRIEFICSFRNAKDVGGS